MNIMIDTNIVIDYLADRAPYADIAEKVFDLCEQGTIDGFLTASTITDIYYMIRKVVGDEQTREHVKTVSFILDIVDVTRNDIMNALDSSMKDFEDALLAECAKRVKANYIVTRNVRDFTSSPVPAIEPGAFLEQLE